MARVITHGNRTIDTTEVLTCPKCGCVFEITDADRKPGSFGSTVEPCLGSTVAHCPECYESVRCRPSLERIRNEREENGERLIQEILNYVEWDKIHEMMEATNWTWRDAGVPSTEQIRATAEERLRTAWRERTSLFSGGIYAAYAVEENEDGEEEEVLKFEFKIEQAHAYLTKTGKIELY